MTPTEMRRRIIVIDAEEAGLRKEKEVLSKQLQEQCDHSAIIETPHETMQSFTMPPRRICLMCGIEEEGWGCGYQKLTREPLKVITSRNEFYRYRTLKPLISIMVPEDLFDHART